MNKILLPLLILLWALLGSWFWKCVQEPTNPCRSEALAAAPIVVPAPDTLKHAVTKEEEVLFRPLDVYFKVNQAGIKRDSSVTNFLGVAKKYLDKYPEEKLLISGYTDSDGSEESNQALSERRAADVKNFLVKEGFKAEHLVTVGKGENNPITSNDTPENKAKNRRCTVVLDK